MKPLVIAVLLALLGAAMPASAGSHMPIEGIGSTCLETILRNCRVLTAGYVNADGGDRDGEPMLAWQTQTGFTPKTASWAGSCCFSMLPANGP